MGVPDARLIFAAFAILIDVVTGVCIGIVTCLIRVVVDVDVAV
jgi:hypothetical protein